MTTMVAVHGPLPAAIAFDSNNLEDRSIPGADPGFSGPRPKHQKLNMGIHLQFTL